jgi:SOS-response transcriptional repressor LexA
MEFKDRLKALRKQAGQRQHHLASAIGVTVQTVSGWERGEYLPEFTRAMQIADHYGIPLDALSSDDFVAPSAEGSVTRTAEPQAGGDGTPHRAPLISRVAAGNWTENVALDASSADRFFDVMKAPLGHVVALEVESGSMRPDFREGDIIIIDSGVPPLPGDFVVAKLDNQEKATFKKYRLRGYDHRGEPIIDLVPLNLDFPTLTISADSPGRIIGTMIEHRRYRGRSDKA